MNTFGAIVHTGTPDTTQTGLSCRVWCGAVNRVRPTSVFSVGVCRAAQALPVRPLDALQRRTYLSGRLNSHRHTTVAPACRPPPPRRRPGRQLRLSALYAKQTVNTLYVLLHMTKPNFFTKRHATRVINRLTVQTLPDGLETQFTPSDTYLAGGVHWAL